MNGFQQFPMPATTGAAAPLRVLVVDDTRTNRQMLCHFLGSRGYVVLEAADGAQAVEVCGREQVDIILMDVMMPVMDGLEATRRIKAVTRHRWLPVVFLTALDNNDDLVKGLEAGGDDYLAKPINFVVLQAKLQALSRSLALQAAVVKQAESLRRYRAAREEEDQLAKEIAMRQMHRQGLADPRIHYWLVPASHLSGDLIAACRSADGTLYAMVADATGHGLPAAVSSMPALALFYSLAEQGLPIDRMVHDLNRHLLAVMPTGRYLCAVLMSISPDGRRLRVWNGGMPDALALDAAGRVVRHFKSRHLALGIVEADEEMTRVEEMEAIAGGQVLLLSDGVIEAANPAGKEFGFPRLEAALAPALPDQRLPAIKAALSAHSAATRFSDDVTLLLVDT
jgi:CheY-like chemotaxis protein